MNCKLLKMATKHNGSKFQTVGAVFITENPRSITLNGIYDKSCMSQIQNAYDAPTHWNYQIVDENNKGIEGRFQITNIEMVGLQITLASSGEIRSI